MTYNGVEILEGDIICFRYEFIWNKWHRYISAAVRFFTNCYWNHSGVVAIKDGKLVLNEAVDQGIISVPIEEAFTRPNVKVLVLRPVIPKENFSERANSKIGVPYDYWNLLFFQLIYRTTGLWVGKTLNGEDKMVCSEYAAWIYDMYRWWLLSTKELTISELFYPVLSEKP